MAMTKTSGQYRLADVVLEVHDYWALRVEKGFEVYRTGITHSTRCAQIGFTGEVGMERVRNEIDRRIAQDESRAAELLSRVRPIDDEPLRERARG